MARDRSNKARREGGSLPLSRLTLRCLAAVLALRVGEVALALRLPSARRDGNLRGRTARNAIKRVANRTARLDRSRIRTVPAIGLRDVVYVCAGCPGGESHRQRSGGNKNRKNSSHARSLSFGVPTGPYDHGPQSDWADQWALHSIKVTLSCDELARLDELRPPEISRHAFLRPLLREPPKDDEVATRERADAAGTV
jgi:hypothetical protein